MAKLTHEKFLSNSEFQTLSFNISKAKIKRDRLLLELLMRTGCRTQEALNITFSDLNVEKHSILIKGLKGSYDREIPIPEELFNKIKKLGTKGLVFPITTRRLRQIWKHYRPSEKSLKSLRHTFAVTLYKKTKDIRLVQLALGHKSISNTEIYAAYVGADEALRKALIDETNPAL